MEDKLFRPKTKQRNGHERGRQRKTTNFTQSTERAGLLRRAVDAGNLN